MKSLFCSELTARALQSQLQCGVHGFVAVPTAPSNRRHLEGLSASNGPGLLSFCLGDCILHVGVAKILIMEMVYGNAGDAEFQHFLGNFRAESRSQFVVVF
jgi:hypothetical protein